MERAISTSPGQKSSAGPRGEGERWYARADSSRFWAVDAYQPGRPQASFDKQPLRDHLDAERKAGRWNGDAPAPPLPASVVEATSQRYLEAYRRITGQELKV